MKKNNIKADLGFKRRKKRRKKHSMFDSLKDAIMYLSDLFVFLMVFTWMYYILMSSPAAYIELLKYGSSDIFKELATVCTIPLTAGGVLWLIRVCVTHMNAQKKGKKCTPDFPNVDDDGNIISNNELDSEGINAEVTDDDFTDYDDEPKVEVDDDTDSTNEDEESVG